MHSVPPGNVRGKAHRNANERAYFVFSFSNVTKIC